MKYVKTIKTKIFEEKEDENIFLFDEDDKKVECSLPNIEKAQENKFFENNKKLDEPLSVCRLV